MSHTDDVIHQRGPAAAAGSVGGEEAAEQEMWWGVARNSQDNDQAVGFDDGCK